eukprot:GILJ01009844.1.p2 GENE.GILJ01009844.1~~GILJ01009844.1.p2  ORF type:complete len:204 (+),score=18.11 GILJ01009844.1:1486-2097(+)
MESWTNIQQQTWDICVEGQYNHVTFDELESKNLYKQRIYDHHESVGVTLTPVTGFKMPVVVDVVDCVKAAVRLKAAGRRPVLVYVVDSNVLSDSTDMPDDLCRRSNFCHRFRHRHTPLPEFGGMYCHDVIFFRQQACDGYTLMDDPVLLPCIIVGGYKNIDRDLVDGRPSREYQLCLDAKAQAVMKIARAHGHDVVVGMAVEE